MQVKGAGRRQVRKLHATYHNHIEGGPCVTGTLIRGLTAVMPERETPSREHLIESAREQAEVVAAARQTIQAWRRHQQGTRPADLDKLAEEARFLIQCARYALRLWLTEGAWSGYYIVPNGAVHNCMGCRTITPIHTSFRPLLDLTGMTVAEVAAKGYPVCSHCRTRAPEKTVNRVRRLVDVLCAELQEIVDTREGIPHVR